MFFQRWQGATETSVLDYASARPHVEAAVAKPGLILKPGSIVIWLRATFLYLLASLPSVSVVEMSAALLDQVLDGFEKDPLTNDDLVRIGRRALEETKG
jgi:hypothetical protein